ncbi:MAG TPA: hypothetical protein VFN67_05360 [Polyangiales bacterium]|nr:hypothetical protein [Polyangiales bacterium]
MTPKSTTAFPITLALIAPTLLFAACGGAETATPLPGAGAMTATQATAPNATAAGAAAPAKNTPPAMMTNTARPTGPTTPGMAQAGAPGMAANMPTTMTTPPTAAAGAGAAGAGAGPAMMAAAGGAAPAMMGEPSSVAGGLPATPSTGPEPKIPMVMGECPEFKNGTIMIGGHRNVMITAGPSGKKGALMFYWHGTGSSAEGEVSRLPKPILDEIASTGSIIAGFNGSGTMGGKGDCSGTGAHNIADFDSGDQLVACAIMKHGIDPRRIYSAGCSAGGLQTGCMAMLRSSYLAAATPNSGGIVGAQPWQDMHSPAVMTMHGGASDMVIVTFSQTSASFDMAAKMHGSFVVNCDHGGGHCAAPNDLKIAYWQFMKDHPFGIEKSPWATAFPPGVPDYCKIY